MFILPSQIFSEIYQYDLTYHDQFKLVIKQMHRIFALIVPTLRIFKINSDNYLQFCSYQHEIINDQVNIEVVFEDFENEPQQEEKQIYICISQYILWKLEKKQFFIDLSWFLNIPITKPSY